MKRFLALCLSVTLTSTPLLAEDSIQDTATNTDRLWRKGSASTDGAYTAVSTTMIAWGIGLAVAIALLAAALNHSSSSSSSSHAHCHN